MINKRYISTARVAEAGIGGQRPLREGIILPVTRHIASETFLTGLETEFFNALNELAPLILEELFNESHDLRRLIHDLPDQSFYLLAC